MPNSWFYLGAVELVSRRLPAPCRPPQRWRRSTLTLWSFGGLFTSLVLLGPLVLASSASRPLLLASRFHSATHAGRRVRSLSSRWRAGDAGLTPSAPALSAASRPLLLAYSDCFCFCALSAASAVAPLRTDTAELWRVCSPPSNCFSLSSSASVVGLRGTSSASGLCCRPSGSASASVSGPLLSASL